MSTNCQHAATNYTYRTFANGTHHACMQCTECGSIVRKDNKLWLKPEDIPQEAEVSPFDEALYRGDEPSLF